jgi:cytochrome c556
MRIGSIALAASAILFATAAASASGGASGGKPAASDPVGIVKGRQAGMRLSAALMGGIKGAIDRGDDVKTQAFAAGSIANWAAAIPGLFPEGSNVPPTGALPTVWSDAPGFAAKAAAYQAAATKLADAAKAGDKAAFAAAFGEVRASCGGCHEGYKKP